MKRLGFYGVAILLQVLVLLVPGHYSWANVGGLAIFGAVYCFNKWLDSCINKEAKDTKGRLEALEKETRAMNQAMQWKD